MPTFRTVHKVAVEAFCVAREAGIAEKGEDEITKAKVAGRLAIAQKKADIKKISDKDLRAMVATGQKMDAARREGAPDEGHSR